MQHCVHDGILYNDSNACATVVFASVSTPFILLMGATFNVNVAMACTNHATQHILTALLFLSVHSIRLRSCLAPHSSPCRYHSHAIGTKIQEAALL